ncbi:MAG: hypothetical protein ABUL60_19845 [Myxococcales bacterium]
MGRGRPSTSAFEAWAETRFLKEALKTQKLEGYWTAYDADGKPKA